MVPVAELLDRYVTNMGADHLGEDAPNDTLYRASEGTNYGWPYCYQADGAIHWDEEKNYATPFDCATVPLAYAVFEAHSAPLGIERFDDGTFLVALHGSGIVSQARGDSIVRVLPDGTVEDYITGFQVGNTRYGRPAGILKEDEHTFYFTDDRNGVLYRVDLNDR